MRWFLVLLLGCRGPTATDDTDAGDDTDAVDTDAVDTVVVEPSASDALLVNPGMGLANFHFGWWCNLPPVTFTPEECAERVRENWPANHPDAGTAYFRWHWRDLEPARGVLDTELIDAALQSANALGETLAFRVMVVDEGGSGLPDWLHDAGVGGEWIGGTFWPDVRDDTFAAEHARLVAALAERYDGHPALDHVDIGTVGCWGEWNTACLEGEGSIIEVYDPATEADRDAIAAAYEQLIDDHLDAFEVTPVVMLGIGSEGGRELDVLLHATSRGAGWRVDCWGDWGIWGSSWSHHTHLYPALLANAEAADPAFADVWKRAPVQLEVCGTMPQWASLGWTADEQIADTFAWAEEVHASVLNTKFTDVPAEYTDALDGLLRSNGYRLALDRVEHPASVTPGGSLAIRSTWTNLGVAPPYNGRALSWRLRGPSEVVLESPADIRGWVPGTHDVDDVFTVPELPAGSYTLEVALVDRPGVEPATTPLPPLQLATAGRGEDGWTAVSEVRVR